MKKVAVYIALLVLVSVFASGCSEQKCWEGHCKEEYSPKPE